MPDLPTRDDLRDLVRRQRRPLAAVSAAAAVLLALSAVTAPSSEPAERGAPPVPEGSLAMPVSLAVTGSHLAPGAVIDVVAVPDDGRAPWVVTRRSTVLEVAGSTGLGASSDASVLLAVSESDGLALAQAGMTGALTALIHADGS